MLENGFKTAYFGIPKGNKPATESGGNVLGSDVHLHSATRVVGWLGYADEKYQMALRMGGAWAGKEVGERLINAGTGEDEVMRCIMSLWGYCKVEKVMTGETIRMLDS